MGLGREVKTFVSEIYHSQLTTLSSANLGDISRNVSEMVSE